METFRSFDGLEIAYLDAGHGPAVILSHGFAADHRINWVVPGVVDALVASGRRVLAPDARGHGRSAKPHDPEAYAGDAMGRDIQALLDHLELTQVDVVGYSMGSLVSARLVPLEPRAQLPHSRGRRRSHGGGPAPGEPWGHRPGLEADDSGAGDDPGARAFRQFAERTGADRLALAAIQRAPAAAPAALGDIAVPTLVLTGDADVLVGPPDVLARKIPGATYKLLHGNHLSAVERPGVRLVHR